MRHFYIHLVLLTAVLLTSCKSSPDVIVVDSTGAPIVGAEIEPKTASLNLKPVLSDSHGEARIGDGGIQEVQWINV